MNITKTLATIALAGILLTGCKDTSKAPENTPAADKNTVAAEAPAKIETASFNIEGMTCAIGCAKTIEGDLSGMDGVKTAKVDFDKKTATVEFDASKQTTEKIVAKVEAAGDGKTYKVSNVKSSGDHAMLIKEKEKKKKDKKADSKKGCAEGKEGKSGCCAGKKSCHGEEKTM